jgi:ABC-type branched-chain amino acid transport system, permease component
LPAFSASATPPISGLGAYTYAIASFNIGESTVPVLLALIVPALVAAIIGAMMFYGRISDVYLGVMTLVVTLILNRFMNATAGDAYKIGNARLGGFNGIPAFPTLNVPGQPNMEIYGTTYYYVVIACLLIAYLISRWILSSAFGRTLIGIRENEVRMELLGYNVPAYKTAIFSVCGAMAGLAGCLFANWAEIVTPSVFSLGTTAEVLIWVSRRRAWHADRADDRRGRARLIRSSSSVIRPRSIIRWSWARSSSWSCS